MTEVLVGARPAHTRTAFRLTPLAGVLLSVALVASVLAVNTGVAQLLYRLLTRPEYSNGIIISFIAAFLVWQHRDQIERMPFPGSWFGLLLALVGAMAGPLKTGEQERGGAADRRGWDRGSGRKPRWSS
jgi:hypothetical protein